MKKTLTTLTILIASVGMCLAQVMTPDWQTMKLKGEVKTLTTTNFIAQTVGDSITKGQKTKATQKYTHSASERINFNGEGYIQGVTAADINGKTSDYVEFKYNKHHLMDETVNYGHDKMLKNIKTYKYDDYGGVVLMRLYGKDKYMVNKTVFKLDREGNTVELKQSDNNKKPLSSRKFAYDKNNNCISTMIFNPTKKLVMTLVSTFDEKNSLVKNITLDANRQPSTSSTYTYKFDILGNWIERTETKNGEPYVITVRDFIFY